MFLNTIALINMNLNIGTRASQTHDVAISKRGLVNPFPIQISAIGADINHLPLRSCLSEFDMVSGHHRAIENHMVIYRSTNANDRILLKAPTLNGS
jgi:hypothetical protein